MYDKATGLMDVYMFVFREMSMEEGSCDVTLCRLEAKFGSQHHHCTNGGPLRNG